MKNKKYGFLLGFTVMCVIMACDLVNAPYTREEPESGYGSIRIVVGDRSRTLFPSGAEPYDILNDLWEYAFGLDYVFKQNDTALNPQPVNMSTTDYVCEVTLPQGNGYTVEVKAYVVEKQTTWYNQTVATGTSETFSIPKTDSEITVPLVPVTIPTGTGELSYNIKFPGNATVTTKLERWGFSGSPVQQIPDEDIDTATGTAIGLKGLDSGSYLFTVNITSGANSVGAVTAVHIYHGMVTEYGTEDDPVVFEFPPNVVWKPTITASTTIEGNGEYLGNTGIQNTAVSDGITIAAIANGFTISGANNNYKQINIQVGTAAGGTDYYASDGFNADTGVTYTLSFNASVDTGTGQLRLAANNEDFTNGTGVETISLTTTAQVFTYSWTQTTGNFHFDTGSTTGTITITNIKITNP